MLLILYMQSYLFTGRLSQVITGFRIQTVFKMIMIVLNIFSYISIVSPVCVKLCAGVTNKYTIFYLLIAACYSLRIKRVTCTNLQILLNSIINCFIINKGHIRTPLEEQVYLA